MTFQELHPKVTEITLNTTLSRDEKLLSICQLLSNSIDYYNWVGFYFANQETKTLHLGPYVGAATDHTVIPFGKGICGQGILAHLWLFKSGGSAHDPCQCAFIDPYCLLDPAPPAAGEKACRVHYFDALCCTCDHFSVWFVMSMILLSSVNL